MANVIRLITISFSIRIIFEIIGVKIKKPYRER
jgi:hypothetical protein